MNFKSKFLQTLSERGFIDNCTNYEQLDATFASQKNIPAYIGFDCTAASLHVGSLVQIMILHHLQQCGHKPIVLVGGGTTKIGDPSGKDESRKILNSQQIQENKEGLKKVFKKYLTFEEKYNPKTSNAILIDNAAWIDDINYVNFLRDIGKHFSVNKMLALESIKSRLERQQHLSFLEFNYVLLQAYDFVKINADYGCILQIGGSDQWGNIVNGIELERKISAEEGKKSANLFGLTTPLLTTSSGKKMGKTASGAVWLDENLISIYDFWQYFRNTEDLDVLKFFKLFTDVNLSEIEDIKTKDINQAKVMLATLVTTKCFGQQNAIEAENTAKKAFEEGTLQGSIPTFEFKEADVEDMLLYTLIVNVGAESSNGSAKRLIKGGGVRINDEKITDEGYKIQPTNIVKGQLKLSIGKKNHFLIRVS